MKPGEIRKLSVDEIRAKLLDSRDELMKLRFQQVTGQLTDTSRLRLLRRDIARMQTIANEMGAEAPQGEAPEAQEEVEEKPKAKPRAKKAKAKAEEAEEGEA